jgi:hypothetical protein
MSGARAPAIFQQPFFFANETLLWYYAGLACCRKCGPKNKMAPQTIVSNASIE